MNVLCLKEIMFMNKIEFLEKTVFFLQGTLGRCSPPILFGLTYVVVLEN